MTNMLLLLATFLAFGEFVNRNRLWILGAVVLIVFFALSGRRPHRRCPKCGELNRNRANFCAQCGERLREDA